MDKIKGPLFSTVLYNVIDGNKSPYLLTSRGNAERRRGRRFLSSTKCESAVILASVITSWRDRARERGEEEDKKARRNDHVRERARGRKNGILYRDSQNNQTYVALNSLADRTFTSSLPREIQAKRKGTV